MLHVIMPYSRPQNYQALLEMLSPCEVQWHLVCHDTSWPPESRPEWVHVHDCGQVPEGFDQCYWKLNWFIEHVPIVNEDRYHYACDDDAVTVESANAFRRSTAPVAMCSMHYGRNPPTHPRNPRVWCRPNIARREIMRPYHCGMAMIAVTGKVLQQMRFDNHPSGDGRMAEWLSEHFEVQFFPDVFVYHNWLEPGRLFRQPFTLPKRTRA